MRAYLLQPHASEQADLSPAAWLCATQQYHWSVHQTPPPVRATPQWPHDMAEKFLETSNGYTQQPLATH